MQGYNGASVKETDGYGSRLRRGGVPLGERTHYAATPKWRFTVDGAISNLWAISRLAQP